MREVGWGGGLRGGVTAVEVKSKKRQKLVFNY